MSGDELTARRRDELGKRMRSLRAVASLTQEQVALRAGLDRSFYVDVENGHHSLTVDRLFSISDALGVSASTLFEGIA